MKLPVLIAAFICAACGVFYAEEPAKLVPLKRQMLVVIENRRTGYLLTEHPTDHLTCEEPGLISQEWILELVDDNQILDASKPEGVAGWLRSRKTNRYLSIEPTKPEHVGNGGQTFLMWERNSPNSQDLLRFRVVDGPYCAIELDRAGGARHPDVKFGQLLHHPSTDTVWARLQDRKTGEGFTGQQWRIRIVK